MRDVEIYLSPNNIKLFPSGLALVYMLSKNWPIMLALCQHNNPLIVPKIMPHVLFCGVEWAVKIMAVCGF